MGAQQQILLMNTTAVASSWAGNMSNTSYASKSFSVNSQDTVCAALCFSADGSKAYVGGRINKKIYQYTLSTPWDASTGSYASKSLDVSTQVSGSSPYGTQVSSDGTKMYVASENSGHIYQYTLSTPYDVSTGSYASKSADITSQVQFPTGIFFSSDGTKMYATDVAISPGLMYQYTLSTPWDLSTVSYASKSFNASAQGAIFPIFIDPSGTNLYGIADSTVYQYALSSAWDISTASYASKSFSAITQVPTCRGIFFDPTGTKMFLLDIDTACDVYQYTVGS